MSGDYIFLPDTPEGRAVEQIALALSDKTEPGQLATARKLARIAQIAILTLVGPDNAASFFAGLSGDCLRSRGEGKGAKRFK